MNADEQEALSRRYSNDRIILLPLRSGKVAVFNNAGELCGIEDPWSHPWTAGELAVTWPPPCYRPVAAPKPKPITIEDLGL